MSLKIFTGHFSNDIDSVYTAVDEGNVPAGSREITFAVDFDSIEIEASEEIKGRSLSFMVHEYVKPDSAPVKTLAEPLVAGEEIIIFDTSPRPVMNRVGGNSHKLFGGILVKDATEWHYQSYRDVRWIAQDYTWALDARFATVDVLNPSVIQGGGLAHSPGRMVIQLLRQMYRLGVNEGAPDKWYDRFRTNVSKIVDDPTAPKFAIYNARNQLPSQVITGMAEESFYLWYVNVDSEIVFEPVLTRATEVGTRGLGTAVGAVAGLQDIIQREGLMGSRAIVEGDVNPTAGPAIDTHFDLFEERGIENSATVAKVANIPIVQTTPVSAYRRIERLNVVPPATLGETSVPDPAPYVLRLEGNPLSTADVITIALCTFDSSTNRLTIRRNYNLATEIRASYDALPDPPSAGNVAILVGNTTPFAASADTLIFFPAADVQLNDYLYILYRSHSPGRERLRSPQAVIDDFADRTGGSGVREFVYSRLDGLNLPPNDRLRVLDAILERKAKVQITGSFKTHQIGWVPGDIFIRYDRNSPMRTKSDGTKVLDRPAETMYVSNTHSSIESPVRADTGTAKIVTEVEYSNSRRGFNA